MKFYWALLFFENFEAGCFAEEPPPKDVPDPEKATYGGGGGGVYFSPVLSDKLTDSPPFGYFALRAFGISLNSWCKVPFVQLLHELFIFRVAVVLEVAIVDDETILI